MGVTEVLSEEFTSEARPTGKEAALHSSGEESWRGPRRVGTPENELDLFDAQFKGRSGWSMRERVSAERWDGRGGRGRTAQGLTPQWIQSMKGSTVGFVGML